MELDGSQDRLDKRLKKANPLIMNKITMETKRNSWIVRVEFAGTGCTTYTSHANGAKTTANASPIGVGQEKRSDPERVIKMCVASDVTT